MVHPKVRVILFLVLLNLPWLFATWWCGRAPESLWLVPFALSINMLWFTYDLTLPFSGLEASKATHIEGRDIWGLNELASQISVRLGQRPPRIDRVDRPSAQIFCYSRFWGSNRLFVTQGLLDLLTPAELREVVEREMKAFETSRAHLNYWAGALIDPVWRVGLSLEKTCRFLLGGAPPIASVLTKPWAWLVTKVLMGPIRALVTEDLDRSPQLDQALWKMNAYAETRPWPEAWVFAHMCLVDPVRRERRPQIRLPGAPA